ncbi:MAG: S41 family peptidase, partial [Bacteroidota bacterium]
VVLINEMTFSGASLIAHYIKQSGRGELVGTTSGGSSRQTYGGTMHTHRLGPAGELTLTVPNYILKLPKPIPGNVAPDHEVIYSRENLLEGEDAQLQVAKMVLGIE